MCSVCATVSPPAISRKYGVISCEFCRRFISKCLKSSAGKHSDEKSPSNILQCKKGDENCKFTPSVLSIRASVKALMKKRCSACELHAIY